MKVATHLIFAECCWFATSAVFDVHYEIPAVLAAVASVSRTPTTPRAG